MTADEIRDFLTFGTRTAAIATTRTDGQPHVVPIWFVLDGDGLIFTSGSHTTKAAAIRREPRVALCVDDETPPFASVMIEDMATLTADAPDLLAWATRIGGRYMGVTPTRPAPTAGATPPPASCWCASRPYARSGGHMPPS